MSLLQDRLVLVVGAPRSGTTWVQRAVAAHPDVLALPSETHLFSSAMSVLRDQAQGGLVGSPATGTWFMPQQEFVRAGRAFCDAALGAYVTRTRPDAARVIERSPTHVWHLGLVASLYPDAWVLHVLRDGRDVVRSQVAQSWGPSQVEPAAALWASAVRSARAAAPELRRYREVRYEDLLHDPSAITEVFDFLELPALDAAVRQSELESGRAVNVDPTRPDVAAGKWRRDWSAEDLAAFDRAAGEVLVEAGYTREPVAPAGPASRPGRRRRRPEVARRVSTPEPELAQRFVDRVVEALAGGDGAAVVAALTPEAVVRVRDGDEDWRLLGAAGATRLQDHLQAQPAWGDPLRGEQQLAGTTWTLVLAHRHADGAVVERLLQLTLAAGPRVAELRLTRFGA